MHGCGNDYVYIDCMEQSPDRPEALAREMSDRHCGIGADGIILILPSSAADFRMRMFNADGSEGAMCGNATRCIGKYVFDRGLTDRTCITLETLSGVKYLHLVPGHDGRIVSVTVDMGLPELTPNLIPVSVHAGCDNVDIPVNVAGEDLRLTAVSMGNPHGVVFVDEVTDAHVLGTGPGLEVHPMWPDRANIEFAQVISPDEIRMRVWERGSGETMACGTGACATAVAAILTGRTNREVTVHLPGGDLRVEWNRQSGHVFMTGGATEVFSGEVSDF